MSWTAGHLDPVSLPPDIEAVALAYLTPLLSATVATRLPNPSDQADTVNDFLRIEAAGGNRANYLQWDLAFIMHAYSPDEIRAAALAQKSLGYAAAARGITIGSTQVARVVNVVAAQRLTDPNVNLIRYRSMVTWRLPGSVTS